MTLLGIIYQHPKGNLDTRIISPRQRPDRRIVGTSGGQGYGRKRPALVPLVHLLLNGPHKVYDINGNLVPAPQDRDKIAVRGFFRGWKLPSRPYVGRVYKRDSDGLFEWRVKSANGNTIAVSHGQGFERAGKLRADGTPTPGTALASLVNVCHGDGHDVDGDTIHPA